VRLFETDIENLFAKVDAGEEVVIVNTPVKVGLQGKQLYMEAHTSLAEYANDEDNSLPGIIHLVMDNSKSKSILVDWQGVAFIAAERDGLPHDIGKQL